MRPGHVADLPKSDVLLDEQACPSVNRVTNRIASAALPRTRNG